MHLYRQSHCLSPDRQCKEPLVLEYAVYYYVVCFVVEHNTAFLHGYSRISDARITAVFLVHSRVIKCVLIVKPMARVRETRAS